MAEPIQQQIERIVHSEQFRSSEVLRRLLTFLSEKAIAGEADNLKGVCRRHRRLREVLHLRPAA